ncbi:hypothetical protein [Amycolatopsis sp. NPDC004625]|uniref:tetratricopeptide repeat protein n=1 Tax=Amycolatopsis sp. NPDC004625 TaxID=3154670 RepID=UPI0033B768BA
MDLGLSHGIRLRFADGLLASALLDLHRKPALTVNEHLLAAGVAPEPLPSADVPVTRVRQGLGIGTRELELVESRDGGPVAAALTQRFDLRSPLDWLLAVDAAGQATERGAVFALPGKITLTVESVAPCALHRGGVRVSLPPGTSELTVTVTSEPVFDVADTVIVCRPDQVREAAIVTSCLPADRLTPIVAIEPPPMPQAEYIELYGRFRRAQDASMQRIGATLGRDEVMSGDPETARKAMAEIAEDHRLRRALSPYRSWLKHNELVSDLVHRMGVRRVVFLHAFAPEELNTRDPALLAEADEVWAESGRDPEQPGSSAMFASVPETLSLPCTDLPGLTIAGWHLLRDPDSAPGRLLDVAIDDLTAWVGSLFVALRTGAVLRAVDHEVPPLDPLSVEDRGSSGDEAVLVENTADTAALLGAVYAHHRGTRLVVTPPPDLEPVQRAVAEQQARVQAGARALGKDVRSADFVGKLWGYLSAGRNPYAAVEAAVTAQVPAAAVAQVGERRLTVFTTGLPYSFVRTADADWATKPIGHVAADPALLILNELYGAGVERSPGTFSLVFDPGFFRTSETPDVLRSVGTHFTHPVLLSGSEASSQALMELSRSLPVELIFFNTHGSDEAIVLADGFKLPSWLIPQWLTMTRRPIVFNNSCQSWTGVGRQFVRAGARGYIGTLWSVPSGPAADFGRIVVDRLTTGEWPASEAIVRTALPSGIERAYLYVGTVNGRLDQWQDRSTTAAEAALAECALLTQTGGATHERISRLLHREITTLRRRADGTPHETGESYVDALLGELWFFIVHDPRHEDDRAAADELVRRLDTTLERAGLPQDDLDRRWARRFELTGKLAAHWSDWGTALADFRRSVGYGEACANRAELTMRMADITMRQGDYDEALALARSARDLHAEHDDRHGALVAVGVLGQLSKRLGRAEEAMQYAVEGYDLAVAVKSEWRQGAFKLDQAALHQMAGDLDAAIAAATRALELSRLIHDDRAEVTAIGRLALCHLDRGDFDAAQRLATTGLAHATRLDEPKEAAAFHHDLGRIAARRGRLGEAVEHYGRSVAVALDCGLWELAAGVVTAMADVAGRGPDVDALWAAATWTAVLCGLVPEPLWSPLLQLLVDAVKQAVTTGPMSTTRRALTVVAEVAAPGFRADLVPSTFVYHLARTLARWVAGEDPAATAAEAIALDVQTGEALALKEFMATPYVAPDVVTDNRDRRPRRWRDRS